MRLLLLMVVATWIVAGPAQAADGKGIYETRCAFCHGVEGRGDGPAGAALKPPPRSFATADYAKGTTLEQVKAVIGAGKQGTAMIAFGSTLKSEEIDAVARYVLGFAPK